MPTACSCNSDDFGRQKNHAHAGFRESQGTRLEKSCRRNTRPRMRCPELFLCTNSRRDRAKVSGDYLPDDELLKDGAALSLYVDKTQMERLEAVERSLAKRADQYGRKGFFCDCASLTKHERLVDAEMALFGKYSESTTHSSYTWRLEALETKTWDERLGQVRGLKAYTSWHPSSLIRMANPQWNPRFSYSRDQPILYPRTVVVDITTN